jgi:hypothetical protein
MIMLLVLMSFLWSEGEVDLCSHLIVLHVRKMIATTGIADPLPWGWESGLVARAHNFYYARDTGQPIFPLHIPSAIVSRHLHCEELMQLIGQPAI